MGSSAVAPTASPFLSHLPPVSLPLDQEAARTFERAYALGVAAGLPPQSPPVSFATLLRALLSGDNETSRWFAREAATLGPKLGKMDTSPPPDVGLLKAGDPPQLSSDKQLLTRSARNVLANAEGWAQQVGGSDIGVRHLVAAYVLNPPGDHRDELLRWEYQEAGWRPVFFGRAAESYRWESWSDARMRPAPTSTVAAFEQEKLPAHKLALNREADANPALTSILDKAAKLHARTTDPFVRVQTLLVALIEVAAGNADVRDTVAPLWSARLEATERYERARDELFPAESRRPLVDFDLLDISPRVLNVLETARSLAAPLTTQPDGGDVRIGALHLAGALVSRRVDCDDVVAALGLGPQKLREAIATHAAATGSAEGWRETLGLEEPPLPSRPVDLNSDDPEAVIRLDEEWKNDPLDIRSDVESFASLLASRSLEPPLSVGVFGPWGSGKTTFLKRLRTAVDRRAAATRALAPGSSAPHVGEVVHVEFNAWHFAEEALTSSLMDAILRAVRDHINGVPPPDPLALQTARLENLKSTQLKVEAATAVADAAKAAVGNAEAEVLKASTIAARAATSWRDALGTAWKATQAELAQSKTVKDSGVLDTLGQAVKDSEDLRTRLQALRSRPARLLGDLGLPASLFFAALVLGLPPLVGWLVEQLTGAGTFGQGLSSTTAVASIVGLWLQTASKAVRRVDAAITEVEAAYDAKIAAHPAVVTSRAALDEARVREETAAAGLAAARTALAQAEVEAASASLPAQMLSLAGSRVDDRSYAKELTTLSLARADLKALGDLLRARRAPGAPASSLKPVERVILYIDDLDRCQPKDVVRVLQLVHMLLTFDLFVVVVAVDERWVEEALRTSYPWLIGGKDDGGRISPQHYLEKIFQVSFWLEPMTTPRAARYLASLIRTPQREAAPPDTDATATTLDIAAIELDFMRALSAHVGPSPRRVKRLVNAYRLIKARMPDEQLKAFVAERTPEGDGPYQIVIGLLVIGTGAQTAGTTILQAIAELDPEGTFDDLVDELRKRHDPDFTMAARVIETLIRTQKPQGVSELRGWARMVSRFLLHTQAPPQGPLTSRTTP